MDDLLSAFERQSDGSWRCCASSALHTHSGLVRFTPGAEFRAGFVFMGIDVARMLNDYAQAGLAPVDWRGEGPHKNDRARR